MIFHSVSQNKLVVVGRVAGLAELYRDGRSVWLNLTQLESEYQASPLVARIVIHADRGEDKLVAVVVPRGRVATGRLSLHSNSAAIAAAALSGDASQVDADGDLLRASILQALAEVHAKSGMRDYERIDAVVLGSEEDLAREPSCITALGKVKRFAVIDRFRKELAALF